MPDDNYEPKDMTGNLHRNTFKKEGEKTPDYRGKAKIFGRLVEIGAWTSKNKNGKTYFSFSFSEPYEGGGGNQAPPPQHDDEVPF